MSFVCRNAVCTRRESPPKGYQQHPVRKSDNFIPKHRKGETKKS